jgi:hypothetical protein
LSGQDVGSLLALGASAEQQDDSAAVKGEINPQARPPVDPPFVNALAHRLEAAHMAGFNPAPRNEDLRGVVWR